MQKYIDAHCHIGRGATDLSVAAFFCNSVTESDWAAVLAASKHTPAVFACLGVHPWRATDIAAGWDARLRDLLVKNPNCMVGEIGLDKLHPDYDIQVDVFRQQMQIANELGRTAHIHCVRAWGDMMRILADDKLRLPAIVLHGFSGAPDIMPQLSRMGNVYFSFGCAVCDPRRVRLAGAVRDVPVSRILIESDGDMCNSGGALRRVVRRVAEIKHMSPDDLSRAIYNNSIQVTQNG